MARGLDTSLQVRDGLKVGRSHRGLLACLQPIWLGLLEQPGFRQMVRESFGLSFHDFRESLLEGICNRGMQRCASALQESRVGSIPHKRVLEGIDRLGYLAPAEYQL